MDKKLEEGDVCLYNYDLYLINFGLVGYEIDIIYRFCYLGLLLIYMFYLFFVILKKFKFLFVLVVKEIFVN